MIATSPSPIETITKVTRAYVLKNRSIFPSDVEDMEQELVMHVWRLHAAGKIPVLSTSMIWRAANRRWIDLVRLKCGRKGQRRIKCSTLDSASRVGRCDEPSQETQESKDILGVVGRANDRVAEALLLTSKGMPLSLAAKSAKVSQTQVWTTLKNMRPFLEKVRNGEGILLP